MFRRTQSAVVVAAVIASGVIGQSVVVAPAQAETCPALQVYGIQGTGQSSTTADPDQDNGFLSLVLGPLRDGTTSIDRKYIPYDAGFGGAVPGGKKPYAESVAGAVATGKQWINDLASRCPSSRVGLVGYSQGGHAARMLANSIVQGEVRLSADKLAVVALFGDPTRPKGASPFPGAPGRTSPAPVPGTSGEAVSQVMASSGVTPAGGGIGPSRDIDVDLSSIAGRYYSACTPGDLACDAPSDAPVVELVTNLAGQSEMGGDPVVALTSLGEALAMTTVKTAIPVINEDLSAPESNLASLSYQPQQTLSSRLAEASDPRSPMPTIDEGLKAIWKMGTIGLNAARTVVRHFANPSTIGQVIAAGAVNPAAVIGVLAPKVTAAAVELVPPATTQRWMSEVFNTFKTEFEDNSDLFTVTSALKLMQTAGAHSSYGTVPATPSGQAPTAFVTAWLRAAAQDVASSGQSGIATTAPKSTTAVLPPPSTTGAEQSGFVMPGLSP